MGDFNFHNENASNADAEKLRTLLFSLGLEQHVKEPTHPNGHCLDLVMTRSSELDFHNLIVPETVISDHAPT